MSPVHVWHQIHVSSVCVDVAHHQCMHVWLWTCVIGVFEDVVPDVSPECLCVWYQAYVTALYADFAPDAYHWFVCRCGSRHVLLVCVRMWHQICVTNV